MPRVNQMNILIDARNMRINQNGPSSYAKNLLLNMSKLESRNKFTVLVNKEYANFINADNFHVITSDSKQPINPIFTRC